MGSLSVSRRGRGVPWSDCRVVAFVICRLGGPTPTPRVGLRGWATVRVCEYLNRNFVSMALHGEAALLNRATFHPICAKRLLAADVPGLDGGSGESGVPALSGLAPSTFGELRGVIGRDGMGGRFLALGASLGRLRWVVRTSGLGGGDMAPMVDSSSREPRSSPFAERPPTLTAEVSPAPVKTRDIEPPLHVAARCTCCRTVVAFLRTWVLGTVMHQCKPVTRRNRDWTPARMSPNLRSSQPDGPRKDKALTIVYPYAY